MRLLRLVRGHPDQLAALHRDRPDLASRSFVEQDRALKSGLAYRTNDSWSTALRSLGWQATERVVDHASAQRAWAREQGLQPPDEDPLGWIAMRQAEAFEPDIVFVGDVNVVTARWLVELRQRCPAVRLVVGWCGIPRPDRLLDTFAECDLTLSCVPELVDRFRARGLDAAHMHHAFDPRVLDEMPPVDGPTHGVVFVGTLYPYRGRHVTRIELLEHLAGRIPLGVWSPQASPDPGKQLRYAIRRVAYHVADAIARVPGGRQALTATRQGRSILAWDRPPPLWRSRALRPVLHPPVFGTDMFVVLRSGAVALNSHLDVSAASASNLRLFEATGVGTCLLTDAKPDLGSLFEVGTEIVTYSSPEDCVERVRWLLDHPAEREEIARRGQRRALTDHTFEVRAGELAELIAARL